MRSAPRHSRSSTSSRIGASSRNTNRSRACSASRRRSDSVAARRCAARTGTRPPLGFLRDLLDAVVHCEHGGRRAQPPAGHAGDAVGAVADEGEEVGELVRPDAEASPDGGLVGDPPAAAIEQHHPVAAHTLQVVVIGRAQHHPLDPRVGAVAAGPAGEQFVGAEPSRRPDRHAEGAHDVDSERHLRLQRVGVARGDELVEGDGDMGDVVLGEQRSERRQQRPAGADLGAIGRGGSRRAVEAAEQLVGPVDEVDLHGVTVAADDRWVNT